jgi:ATP-dependent Clp protease ATP-binding subunit ClpA
VFERFTERARLVVVLAQEEARALNHNSIGTVHLLLGVVRENQGVAARILLDFDADAEKIRSQLIGMLEGSVPDPPRPVRRPSRTVVRRRDWLPVAAAGAWALFGLAVGVLLGWAIWG